MSLAGLPPWIDSGTSTFLSAIHAGAAAGAQLRGQDIERSNAGDRLRLAYAQLQSQEERASEQAAAKLDLAHAELSARQNQENLMNQFRMQTLKQESDRASELADYREQSLTARGASLAQRTEAANALNEIRGQRLSDLNDYRDELQSNRDRANKLAQDNLDLRRKYLSRPKLTEADRTLMGADVSELKGVEKKLGATESSGVLGTLFHTLANPTQGWVNPGDAEITNLKGQALNLRRKIASYEPQRLSLGGVTDDGEAAQPAADTTPFREGALIRNKKTGKLFRVKGGDAVPEESSSDDTTQ